MQAAEALLVNDRLLERRIAGQLAGSNRASLRQLAVNVTGGSVTLRGSVATFYEKQLAIQTCRMLAGLERLIDAVEVAAAT
jgi:osmotically-inducible protein OsmY